MSRKGRVMRKAMSFRSHIVAASVGAERFVASLGPALGPCRSQTIWPHAKDEGYPSGWRRRHSMRLLELPLWIRMAGDEETLTEPPAEGGQVSARSKPEPS